MDKEFDLCRGQIPLKIAPNCESWVSFISRVLQEAQASGAGTGKTCLCARFAAFMKKLLMGFIMGLSDMIEQDQEMVFRQDESPLHHMA